MEAETFISIIIPNYNGSNTIGRCLEAALASKYGRFEIVVVDDCSADDSAEIIKRYPCTFIRLEKHAGASAARNRGAERSRGEALFFIDADCLIQNDTLALANESLKSNPGVIIGGTYSPLPADSDFFSTFQSLFIHYSETKGKEPDYIASHALVIDAQLFRETGGFPEEFLPILEDVEFSHRLRRTGCRLIMNPEIQVTHVFNFTLGRSLRNAFRKSLYWTLYSITNKDLLADSGTASRELKTDVLALFLNLLFLFLAGLLHESVLLVPAVIICTVNSYVSRGLFALFLREKGPGFTAFAVLYYLFIYPLPVGAGGFAALMKHALIRASKRINIS